MARVFSGVGFVVTLQLMATGCSGESSHALVDSVKVEPVPLVAGLRSYASLSELRATKCGSRDCEVVEQFSLPEGDRRPEYTVVVLQWTEPAIGVLRARIFNDRLSEIRVYPSKGRSLRRVMGTLGLSSASGNAGTRRSEARVWTDTDHAGKDYIGVTDARLRVEEQRWLEQHS